MQKNKNCKKCTKLLAVFKGSSTWQTTHHIIAADAWILLSQLCKRLGHNQTGGPGWAQLDSLGGKSPRMLSSTEYHIRQDADSSALLITHTRFQNAQPLLDIPAIPSLSPCHSMLTTALLPQLATVTMGRRVTSKCAASYPVSQCQVLSLSGRSCTG